MSKKTGNYQIPFDRDGNQVDYPDPHYSHLPTSGSVWFDNFEFTDTLDLVDYGRGRSSITFYLKRRSTGTKVTMFAKDLFLVAKDHEIERGAIRGTFTFTKRGANYGCRLIPEATL